MPQYILMFEKLLAKPGPHEYVHLLLHRGDDDEDLNPSPSPNLKPNANPKPNQVTTTRT